MLDFKVTTGSIPVREWRSAEQGSPGTSASALGDGSPLPLFRLGV